MIEAFLTYCKVERGLSPNTIDSYGRDLQQFKSLLPRSLEKATRDELRQVFAQLQARGLDPRSLARKMSSLRHFYRFLRRKRIIAEVPLKNIPLPKLGHTLPKPVSDADFSALLQAALLPLADTRTPEGLRDYAMFRVLESCGLRASELLSLTLTDLHLEEGHLVIHAGKGDKDRFVPIDAPAIQALELYLERARPTGLVFPITRQRIWQIIRKFCKQAGIPLHHPHQIRHRFGSELVKSGLELREVADMMGHASTDTTQLYVGLDMTYIREVFRKTHPRAVRK